MPTTLEQRCRDLVVELGLGTARSVVKAVPLAGGVASDIALVTLDGHRRVCAKFALEKLRVQQEWRAPMHRNRAEYEWLRVANAVVPESAVELFGVSESQHGFAMEFIDGDDVYLWKARLLEGLGVDGEAARVGDSLGRIHAASACPDFARGPFANRDDFRAIRIEPYLSFTAGRYPQVAPTLEALAHALYVSDRVLVHGDVSPKNILFRAGLPILLDAECATMGDACFDPAFCLNHLILKALHLRRSRAALLAATGDLWMAYAAHIHWEAAPDLEARVCALLPALLLARVDGKSPVDYLGEAQRDWIRKIAIPAILEPAASVQEFTSYIAQEMETIA